MFLHTRPWTASDSSPEEDAQLPGVSILRPLSGLDTNLFINLCSTFEQDYPHDRYEIIFSVRDEKDEALVVAREVLERYRSSGSGVSAKILIGDVDAGVNPKINNLLRPYEESRYDILWVLDSQVNLQPSALRNSVHALCANPPPRPSPSWLRRNPHGSRVGLVHHVPFGVDARAQSLGSQVEKVFLSTTHAKMYLAINSLAVDSCVMGKSNLWRKSDLERVPDEFFGVGIDGVRAGDGEGVLGSDAFNVGRSSTTSAAANTTTATLSAARPLARFSIYLAEDNMLALSLWRPPLSLSHTLAPSSACVARTNVADIRSLTDYISRRSRWIRVRRYMVPAATYTEPFTESIVAGILGWYALSAHVGPIAFCLLHFGLWFSVDLGVYYALSQQQSQVGSNRKAIFHSWSDMGRFFGHWSLREILALPIWCFAMWGGNEVVWRGRPFRILSDSRAAVSGRARYRRGETGFGVGAGALPR